MAEVSTGPSIDQIRVIIRRDNGFIESSADFDGTTWEAQACRIASELMGEPHTVDYRLPDQGDTGTITYSMKNGRYFRDESHEQVAVRFGSDQTLFFAFSALQSGLERRARNS